MKSYDSFKIINVLTCVVQMIESFSKYDIKDPFFL